ncbi:nodulation protein NodZ [Aurantiacibacter aquimixticola]|nr:nodulation protein NodZ [Aurantiacibacter aquimixticola]
MNGRDKNRFLVIKAKGGLGNRMLSAATGIVLAQLDERSPSVDWRDGMYVPTGVNLYPLLFNAAWMEPPDRHDHADSVTPAIWAGKLSRHPVDLIRADFPDKHQDPLLYRKLSIDLTGKGHAADVAVFWSYVPKLHRLTKRLRKDGRFTGLALSEIMANTLATHFQPLEEVSLKVDKLFGASSRPKIGVHVRYTDRRAPLSRIIGRLESVKNSHRDAEIFLATDSQEASDAITSRFSDVQALPKILASEGHTLHFEAGEMTDPLSEARYALADMVALSRCDWLIHSSHSTFSVTAALMGGIPKKRQIDVDALNLKVRTKQFFQARL